MTGLCSDDEYAKLGATIADERDHGKVRHLALHSCLIRKSEK